MNILYADYSSTEGSGTSFIVNLIPLMIIGALWGYGVLKPIAKSKGKNQWFWFAAGFIPVLNIFGVIYLLSLTDIAVKEQLDKINKELQELKSVFLFQSQKIWTCTCGKVNSMDAPNCPECGLKRDFLIKKKE